MLNCGLKGLLYENLAMRTENNPMVSFRMFIRKALHMLVTEVGTRTIFLSSMEGRDGGDYLSPAILPLIY